MLSMKNGLRGLFSFLLSLLVLSCGGGGGSPPPASSVGLLISEVSNCIYIDDSCWVEIYNPNATSVDLSQMVLQAPSLDMGTLKEVGVVRYTLPSYILSPGQYVVLTGNVENATVRNSQKLWLRSGAQVPSWYGADGFVELLDANGGTIDFVRFGSSTQEPVSAGQWSGASAVSLGVTQETIGHTLVRPAARMVSANADTHTAADWVKVAWGTPGGPNDVSSTAVDADGDGIPDSAEVPGGTFAGLNLYAMGARTGVRDIFIEVDRMVSIDNGIAPRQTSLQMVVDAFASKGIQVHFDAGTQFSSSFSATDFNLGQGSNTVAYEPCVTFDRTTCIYNMSARRSIYDWKEGYFDLRRRSIFHYALFANSQNADGTSGSSGIAEVNGNDIVISLGGLDMSASTSDQNILTNFHASTVMHELGHNLGLLHGGNEDVNYKPNYYSIMNYLYSITGLESSPDSSTVYLRWKHNASPGTIPLCSLPQSPCGSPSQYLIDYSNGQGAALVESNLDETHNIGYGSNLGAFADWDLDGLVSTFVSQDINSDGQRSTLTDYNDWGNIVLPFTWTPSGAQTGVNPRGNKQSKRRINPMTNDNQPIIIEPLRIKDWLKHVH